MASGQRPDYNVLYRVDDVLVNVGAAWRKEGGLTIHLNLEPSADSWDGNLHLKLTSRVQAQPADAANGAAAEEPASY